MQFWEAMKLLEEGKKIRRKWWSSSSYIMLKGKEDVVDEKGNCAQLQYFSDDLWEIYDSRKEPSKEIKQIYEALKVLGKYYMEKRGSKEAYEICLKLDEEINELEKSYKLGDD